MTISEELKQIEARLRTLREAAELNKQASPYYSGVMRGLIGSAEMSVGVAVLHAEFVEKDAERIKA